MKIQMNLNYDVLLPLHKMSKATGRSREELIVEAIVEYVRTKDALSHLGPQSRRDNPRLDETKPATAESLLSVEGVGNSDNRNTFVATSYEKNQDSVSGAVSSLGVDSAIVDLFRIHDKQLSLQDIQKLFMTNYVENLREGKPWWLSKTAQGEPRYKQHVRAHLRRLMQKGALESPQRGVYRLSSTRDKRLRPES
jgi:hypothetical protein